MTPRNHTTGSLVFTIAFAVTLLPAAALAQAGLSGDPFSGQEAERLGRSSQFDKGFQSKSALGQLEELTGTKVNRPSSQRTVVPRAAAQARSVTPRFDANQMFRQELAGAVVGALFANIFADNSAQERAAAEAAAAQRAAQAAAEAEAFRVQQELARQARIQRAQHYRAEWDARETEVTDRLGGAFDVAPATSFFGRPANPDADAVAAILGQDIGGAAQASGEVPDAFASDPSVVDLRGSSLVVQPLRPPTRVVINGRSPTITRSTTRAPAPTAPRWADDWPETDESTASASSPNQLRGLADYFGPLLGKWYWESVAQGTAKATLWGLAKNVRGQQYAKALYDFNGQRTELTQEVSDSDARIMRLSVGDSQNLVRVLTLPTSNGGEYTEEHWISIPQRVRAETAEFFKLAFGQGASRAELDLGELGSGE